MSKTRKKSRVKSHGKTRKKVTKVQQIVKIFKQYPEVFPRGYFRFLEGTLKEKIKNKEIIFKNGVVLTWKKYKVTPGKYKKMNIKKGDIKINQLVNKKQGNGAAKKIFVKFLKKHSRDKLFLDVRTNNKRAIEFYKKSGFRKIGNTTFGTFNGIVMVKQPGNSIKRGG